MIQKIVVDNIFIWGHLKAQIFILTFYLGAQTFVQLCRF